MNEKLRGLYVITHENLGGGHLAIARAAIAGGAKIIQLRDKSTALREIIPIGQEIRRLTLDAAVLFIVNDRPDLALALEADGVHLGPDDLPPREARKVLGEHRIIGVSCGGESEARRAEKDGANYIGAGAIFGSATKLDAGAPIGIDGLRAIVSAISLPVAAIGGVDSSNIAGVKAAGASMVCVVSAVAGAGDEAAMERATRELANVLL